MKKLFLSLGLAVSIMAFPCVTMAADIDDPVVAEVEAENENADVDGNVATEAPVEQEPQPEQETQTEQVTQTEPGEVIESVPLTNEEMAEVIVNSDSKPFIALGNDLSEEQLNYVLSEMGITKDELANYRVIYVTNDLEHKYLDTYIDPALIGTHSLSCVMVKQNEPGTGIRVTTKNIDYCTINMYKNALLTAGVEDADVLVVGPFPISGTAALIGAWQAYEEMSGEVIPEERKTAALAEMIVMGDVSNEIEGVASDKVEEFIEYIKAEVIANDLDSLDEIKDAISNAEKEFNINLTEEQVNQIADVMKKISDLDIDPKVLLQQAGELYNKYGDTILSEAKDALNGIFTDEVKASLWDLIKQFFKTIFEAIANFFNK